jgi:hypothetical protein
MSIRLSPPALACGVLLALSAPVWAQSTPAPSTPSSSTSLSTNDWKFSIYPILAWVPAGIEVDLNIPSIGNGEGGDAGFAGEIVDSRFDGAFLGGFSATNNVWRLDTDGLWAAVGGDRPQLPKLTVDVDVIYFHVSGGRKIVKDLFVTAGVRRLALKYNILALDQYAFERKPGVWDPLVGLAWHTVRQTFEFHATSEVGGFGVGSNVEVAGSVRADWKPFTHFGLTGGYQWLYFKVEDEVRNRPFTVKQTLHGPIVGIGLYF